MCGFVGVVRDPSLGPVTREELEALLPDLAHRGPDGSGVVVGHGVGLAATRLAIQGDHRSDQPVLVAQARLAVAFNGELLRSQQEALRDALLDLGGTPPEPEAGDTALLAAFFARARQRDGRLCGYSSAPAWRALEKAMGALAVIDLDGPHAWIGADRRGIKPLYVTGHLDKDREAWFGSTVRVVLRGRYHGREVGPLGRPGFRELWQFQALNVCLPLDHVDGGDLFRARPLDLGGGPGPYPCLDLDDLAPAPGRPPASDSRQAVGRLGLALITSAREAAAVDGPVSLFLSGGIDSAAVAAFAGRSDLLTLTGRFAPAGSEDDESAAAAVTARHLGLRHEIVELADADLVADLEPVIRALEFPVAGPGSLAFWRLARRAAEHGRVVLTGTGADELLGGYARTALALGRAGPWTRGYEGLAARLPPQGSVRLRSRRALDRRADLAPFFDPGFLRWLEGDQESPLERDRPDRPRDRGVDDALRLELEFTLPNLLHVEDRVLMAHGLEGRPVFCLGDVPDAALALPPEEVIGPDGEGKVALRKLLEGRIPESVRMDRRKRGFPTPFGRAARGAGRERVEAILADRRFRERGWWNVAACRALLDEERPPHDRALFALLSWEIWARLFLDGDVFRGPPAPATPSPGAPVTPGARGR